MSGFAFGSKYVASLSTNNNNTADEDHTTKPDTLRSATIPPNLEGDISQQLQKLLKKDATTKAKALQSLQSAIQDKPPEAVELALPFWSYVYPKLLMDNNRSVRSEACLAMGKLGIKLGRRIAPYVKNIFPPWWLTSFDVHREVAHAAKSSLQLVFPNEKLKEAVMYTDNETIALLTKLMASTPQSIGDARRETSDEMMERHQRMLAACCTALASIASSSSDNNNNNSSSIKRVVEEGSFIKNCLQSKSPVVRQHAYSLIATIAASCPLLLLADDDNALLQKLALPVLGSIGDIEPSTYSKLWEMVLSFSKAFPHSWDHVKPQKTVFPRLLSLLRHSCYGAPEVCLPAVLPFLGLLPPTVFPSPAGPFYSSLISSIWDGRGATRAAQQAASDCVGDCTLYILLKRSGADSSCSSGSDWQDTLIDAWKETLFKSLFSSSGNNDDDDNNVAMDVFKYLVAKLKQYQGWQLEAVVGAIAAGLLDNVMTSPSQVTMVVSTLAADIPHDMGSRVIAQPLYDALKGGNSNSNSSDNEATLLLASLVRLYPEVGSVDAQMQNLQLDGSSNNTNTKDIIANIIASKNDAQEMVEANCQLLMSYIMNDKHGAAADFAQAVDAVFNLGTDDMRVVLHTLLKSAVHHHESSLEILQSAALDGIALHPDMDKVSLVLLLTGDGSQSLLTQQGQSSLLSKLSSSHGGAEHDDDKDAVGILVEVIFSPALNCGGYDTGSTAKQQLSALCFLTEWWLLPDTGEDSVSKVWRKVDEITLLLASCSSDKHEFASRLGTAIQHCLVVESTHGESYNTDSSKHLAEKINLILTTCSSDKAVQNTIMKTALGGVSFNLHIAMTISYLLPLAGYEAVFPAADDKECARQIYNLLLALMESSSQDEYVLSMIHHVLLSGNGSDTATTIMQQHILHLCIEGTRHTDDNGGHVAIEEALLAHIVNTLISIDKVDALEQSVSVEQPEQLFDVVPMNALRVILKEAAPIMRSVETSTAIIISTLFQQLCTLYTNNNDDQSILELAALCWPLKNASQVSFFNQQPSISLTKGMQVWYTHRDGTREAAVITSIDLTISPPSYAVQLGDTVRETVVERLRVRHHNDSSSGLGSSEPSPSQIYFSDEDKKILVELLSAMMMQPEDDAEGGQSSQYVLSDQLGKAHIMCAASMYCSDILIKAQWEGIIEYHQQMMMMQAGPLIQSFITSAVKTARDAANIISGLEFDSSRAALHFLARLEVTGVLARSKKARECCEQAAAKIFREDMSPLEDAMQMMQVVMLLGAAINQFAPQCRMLETLTVQQAVSSCCSTILDTFLSLGAFMGAAHCLGTTSQAEFQYWCQHPRIAPFLEHLGIASHGLIAHADMEFLKSVVDKAAESCGTLGTDAVGALVNIAALPATDDVMVMMRNAGWKAFSKHKDLLLTLSVGTAHDDDDGLRDSTSSSSPGGRNGDDMLAVLEFAGICPELSTLLVSPESRLGAFSLLVGHILIMPHNSDRRRHLVQHLGDAYTMLTDLMNEVVEMLPLNVKLNTHDYKVSNITRHSEFCDSMLDLASQHVSHDNNNNASCLFAEHVYGGALCALPASCRTWYTDLRDRSLIVSLDRYTAAFVTPQLIAEQVGVVVEAASQLNDEKFSVKASIASQEVVASLDVEDGHRLELTIKMPSSMPLKAPEARCSKSVGVSESRLRKWLISIAVYLRAQNGTLVDAMLLWKRNVDRQFEGQEECLICYAIIQPANGQLPKLQCRTCRKRFHGQCLYKWFKSSGKSNCPHCQSPW